MSAHPGRILTTHVGSLPRSQAVTDVLFARERDEARDAERDDAIITEAVAEVVRRQVEVGIDIVSDGEMSKISYATYIARRLGGFAGDTPGDGEVPAAALRCRRNRQGHEAARHRHPQFERRGGERPPGGQFHERRLPWCDRAVSAERLLPHAG